MDITELELLENAAQIIRALLGTMPPALQNKWPNVVKKANSIVKSIEGLESHCLWLIDCDSDIWETGCGNSFVFEDGGTEENNFEFCPYCGMAIKTGEE